MCFLLFYFEKRYIALKDLVKKKCVSLLTYFEIDVRLFVLILISTRPSLPFPPLSLRFLNKTLSTKTVSFPEVFWSQNSLLHFLHSFGFEAIFSVHLL